MLSLARQRLLGLVHGLPGDRRRLRGLMAVRAYKANIDGSGFVATVEQWLPFADEWDGIRKQLSQVLQLQMSGARPYRLTVTFGGLKTDDQA